jgi:hypothetical protein
MGGSRISDNLLQLFKSEQGVLVFQHVLEPTLWYPFAILERGNLGKGASHVNISVRRRGSGDQQENDPRLKNISK